MKTLLIWVALIVVFLIAFQVYSAPDPVRVDVETFISTVREGGFDVVWMDGAELAAVSDNRHLVTFGDLDEDQWSRLVGSGVRFETGQPSGGLGSLLFYVIVALVTLLALVFFLRRMQGGGGGVGNIFELRRSRAKLIDEESRVRFEDVGGCTEAKLLLGDVVDFLREPKRWIDAGARLPRGILLEGPPGCGKTLLARAVAGETDAKFYTVSASEFVELFVGVGAARVRDTFETAGKTAPSVIFIDELDAVGRRRGSGMGAANDEREHTLNQLLVSLDGFRTHDRVVAIAATNRADVLDPALLRPGRFDRRIRIDLLGRDDRAAVLAIHARNKRFAGDISLEEIADLADGFNGAQLESLLNEAALLAVRRVRLVENGEPPEITRADIEAALAPTESRERIFDSLDAILVESTTQLAEPTGRAVVRCEFDDGTAIEGEVAWMDANFVKLQTRDGRAVVIPKHQVRHLEPLAGTARATDVRHDVFAGRQPDVN